MGIDIKELRKKIEEQAFRYRNAMSNGMMVAQETERMKNILINNLGEIIDALKMAEGAEEQIKTLEAEVDSADAELKELDDEIKKLRAASNKPVRGKRKEVQPVDEFAGVESDDVE